MKFLKENWFKLMTGTSMLVFSFAFLTYAVSPSYANETSEVNKPQMEYNETAFSVVSGGYIYTWSSASDMYNWSSRNEYVAPPPKKRKLP